MKWSKHMFCLLLLLGSVGCSVYAPNQLLPDSGFIETKDGLAYRHVTSNRKSVYDRAHTPLPSDVMSAQELRLKVRELVDQLLTTRDNRDLVGLIALPTNFVNLNNLTGTTPLGRFFSESMFYEFGQRGFPIREYRLRKAPVTRDDTAELVLNRTLPPLLPNQEWSAILVGTYLIDKSGVFIHMRMLRVNGDVLRTAQLFLPTNRLLTRLLVEPPRPPKPPNPPLQMGSVAIQSAKK